MEKFSAEFDRCLGGIFSGAVAAFGLYTTLAVVSPILPKPFKEKFSQMSGFDLDQVNRNLVSRAKEISGCDYAGAETVKIGQFTFTYPSFKCGR